MCCCSQAFAQDLLWARHHWIKGLFFLLFYFQVPKQLNCRTYCWIPLVNFCLKNPHPRTFFTDSRERGREKKMRDKHWCEKYQLPPIYAPTRDRTWTWVVLWLEIELATLYCVTWHSNKLSHTCQGWWIFNFNYTFEP